MVFLGAPLLIEASQPNLPEVHIQLATIEFLDPKLF